MKTPESFKDAEVLADFANLDRDDASAVDYFRNNYPDFAPAEWWNYKFEFDEPCPMVMAYGDNPINPADYGMVLEKCLAPAWEETQSQVWVAWETEFKFPNIFTLTALLRSVYVAPAEMVLTSSHIYLSDGELCELGSPKLYTFHKAVLYLHQNPWHARLCKNLDCGKYFVASHPKQEFCKYPNELGVTCRQKNDNDRHLVYYHEVGKEKRQSKNKKISGRKKF